MILPELGGRVQMAYDKLENVISFIIIMDLMKRILIIRILRKARIVSL